MERYLVCKHGAGYWKGQKSNCIVCRNIELEAEVERLQARIEFLEDAFRAFSHEVTLEDVDSGRLGIMPRHVVEAAEAADAAGGRE